MPIIVIVGEFTDKFAIEIANSFADTYEPVILKGHFQSIRSELANQHHNKLYIIPSLEKPERYEIFCLARKNQQSFVSIANSSGAGLSASDKNVIKVDEAVVDISRIREALKSSKLTKNPAHIKTKGLSMKSLCAAKAIISEVNKKVLSENPESIAILRECEDRALKMAEKGFFSSTESFKVEYKKLVEDTVKRRASK